MDKKIINRQCSVCGKEIKVILYKDGKYRGGHYFGDLYNGGKFAQFEIKNGEFVRIGKWVDHGPRKFLCEYWECSKCFKSK